MMEQASASGNSASDGAGGWRPPFPALTRSQRWHLEVNGYVVVEDVFDEAEVARMRDALLDFKAEFEALDDPWNTIIRGAKMYGQVDYMTKAHFDGLEEGHSSFLEYAIHPRIIGMVEEVVGLKVRLSEFQATINKRDPTIHHDGLARYHWHRNRPGHQTYVENGLHHGDFVKAITNLTDLGPDDGGTSVVAGSHKSSAPEEAIVKAVREDPSLVHQVVAPAGSTLIFCETLLHSAGDPTSDNERVIIISGYRPSNHLTSSMRTYSEGFGDQIPEEARYIIFGAIGSPRLRRRELDWDVDSADPGSYSDGWSLASADPASLEVVGGHNVRQTSAPEPRKDG